MTDAQRNLLQFCNYSDLKSWDYNSLISPKNLDANFPLIELGKVIKQRKKYIVIQDDYKYNRCRVQIQGKGIVLRDSVIGQEIKTKRQQLCKKDDFLVAEIDAKVGGYGIVPDFLENAIVSDHYFLFEIDKTILIPEFLALVVRQPHFFMQIRPTGSTNYAAIRPYHVLAYKIPLPPLSKQRQIINTYNSKIAEAEKLLQQANNLEKDIEIFLTQLLGIDTNTPNKQQKGLGFVEFKDLINWGVERAFYTNKSISKFKSSCFESDPSLLLNIFRGKSPVYSKSDSSIILNQKCNRWNHIDLSFAKNVNANWLNGIDSVFFTRENDIIINSTGDGTIGRASRITHEFTNLLYDSHILLLRLNFKLVNPEYFVEIFNNEFIQRQIDTIKSAQSTKQTELGIGNLKKIYFPIPPINVQKRIIETISRFRNKIDDKKKKNESLITSAKEQFEQTVYY